MRALLQISASPEKKLAYDIVHANPSWRDDGASGVLGRGGHHERDPNLRFNSLEEKEKLLSCLKFAVKKAINLESYRKLPFWFASENLGVTQQFVDRLLHKALFHCLSPYIRGMPVANCSITSRTNLFSISKMTCRIEVSDDVMTTVFTKTILQALRDSNLEAYSRPQPSVLFTLACVWALWKEKGDESDEANLKEGMINIRLFAKLPKDLVILIAKKAEVNESEPLVFRGF